MPDDDEDTEAGMKECDRTCLEEGTSSCGIRGGWRVRVRREVIGGGHGSEGAQFAWLGRPKRSSFTRGDGRQSRFWPSSSSRLNGSVFVRFTDDQSAINTIEEYIHVAKTHSCKVPPRPVCSYATMLMRFTLVEAQHHQCHPRALDMHTYTTMIRLVCTGRGYGFFFMPSN